MNNGIIAMIRDRSWFFGLLGRLVLYTFPVLGILGVLALLALKQYQYLILSIYMVVPIICAPIAYLLIRKKQETGSPVGDDLFKFLVAGFLICFAFSLTLLYAFEIRPTLYYLIVAAMATLIFIQIVCSKITQGKVVLILLQIMALVLNVCWGISLHYFQYVGRTDILIHTFYAESVVLLGHVTSDLLRLPAVPALAHHERGHLPRRRRRRSRSTRSWPSREAWRSRCCPSSCT